MNAVIEQNLEKIIATKYIDWTAFKGKTVLISGTNGMQPSYMVDTLLFSMILKRALSF